MTADSMARIHLRDTSSIADDALCGIGVTAGGPWVTFTNDPQKVTCPSCTAAGAGMTHAKQAQLVAGYLTGAAYDTEQQLDHVQTLIEQAELHKAQLVAKARREGISWTRIGQATGTSKQAAQKRYGEAGRS